jgi:hypothetical protein
LLANTYLRYVFDLWVQAWRRKRAHGIAGERMRGEAAVTQFWAHVREKLDEVFWLEEERVVSEDWVVRYQNRLLQLEPQSQHWAPAKSRVLVRENQTGELAIHYRDHRLVFRELKAASTSLSEARGAAPSPAPPSPKLRRSLPPAPNHPWRLGFEQRNSRNFPGAA